MKAVVVRQFGLEHTFLEEVEAPPLGLNDIRIQVHSAGVSFANLLAIEGKHQNRADPPFTPGTEVAGIVLEVGAQTRIFQPGDRVVAGVRRGGYANEAVVPENKVFALPDNVDFDAAVHFPTIYSTAYGALQWRARIQAGETLLVHGAAGGSGLAAIEIGKQLGARIIASTSGEAKLSAAAQHGADICIDYKNGGFREQVLAHTNGRGADVIFDPVGGDVFDESLRCIAPEGRIIPMGFAGGKIPNVPANILLVKNITVIGIYWGYYMGWARQPASATVLARTREAFAEMLQWASEGHLHPHTSNAFPLSEFRAALSSLSGRQVIGRNVLNP